MPQDRVSEAREAAVQERTSPKTGPEVIASYLKNLPNSPGVYRMIDAKGDVIYVGKARSLKARVANYTRFAGHSTRIARMISQTAAMEFVLVGTEAEALLLEANLIKRFRPRFNVLMRDDKSFPYILIARDHRAPQILKHRGARTRRGEYFGPFASAGAVNRTITMLQRAFLLRSCSDAVYETRTRPCLLYQIKRCSAPCTGEISLEDYNALVDEATRFLRGESQNVRRHYQKLMEEAAEALEFERAAELRNRLWALAHVTADQAINPEGVEEADVFAIAQDGGQTCVQVFFIRSGQNWGNRAYFPKADRSLGTAEVLESFIAQFYDDKPVPRLLLLSENLPGRALLAEALSSKADRRVEVRAPQRGSKLGVVEHALRNAREALARRLAESSSQRILLEGIAERFGLPATPRRIEVFDNSHIMGTNAVGAMIVAGPDGFVKSQYRKFNIKSADLTPGDDYAMMREVLTRRFKRLADKHAGERPAAREPQPVSGHSISPPDGEPATRIEPPAPDPVTRRGADGIPFGMLRAETVSEPGLENHGENRPEPPDCSPALFDETPAEREPEPAEEEFPDRPDLVLIDGGAGQLGVAADVLRELGIEDIPIVGVAKGPDRDAGREHFYLPGREKPFMLEPRDPVLYFVQRLRDEAHRFAIGTHRARRAKAISANPLDEIPGIGPTRKRALLQHFGSAKAVSRAGVADLRQVPGISAQMAQTIYDFFHERSV
ncbi:MAG TPA: excinuclease ABC subunit UvrC [Hyphomicrobiaceae bacterium]